jgi:hypothetical protein
MAYLMRKVAQVRIMCCQIANGFIRQLRGSKKGKDGKKLYFAPFAFFASRIALPVLGFSQRL